MAKSKNLILVEKSINALISAIEIYNKPDFKYREENFCILLINAWELLFKAKILKDNKNKLNSLYVKEFINKKDGGKSKKWRYKTTRSGNIMTKDILYCIKEVMGADPKLISNIETLIELRDNSIHFYNNSVDFVKTVHEIGSASVYDFIHYLKDWFNLSLNKYNLYLLPLSFFGGSSVESVPLFSDEKKLLEYIENLKQLYPYKKADPTHYAFQVEITLTKKSKGTSGLYLTNDPSATKVQLSDEDLQNKYPLSYYDLCDHCKKRYKDFKTDRKFFDLKKKYEDNLKYCYKRFPGLNNTGQPRKYYSSAILEVLDKNYEKIT